MTRRAAAVVIHRPVRGGSAAPGELDVYLVLRSPELAFLGNTMAFPGGVLERGDEALPLAGLDGDSGEERAVVACAARELLEETGILAAAPNGPTRVGSDVRGSIDGPEALRRLLQERDLRIDGQAFVPLTRLVTPPFSRRRYDTSFYLLELPAEVEPEVLPGELVRGVWLRPIAALEAWRRAELRLSPPAHFILEQLSSLPLPRAIDVLRAEPRELEDSRRVIAYAPGYEILPFETPPLPASVPTNTLLIGGRTFIVLDPAPRLEKGKERLLAAIAARLEKGDRLLAVVLTHHHPDHVGTLDAVLERWRPPLWAHARTGELLGRPLARALDDGDEIELGEGSDGRGGWTLRALFTPGHAEGHLALHDERYSSLAAGDLVSTLLSMYVGAPGGSLRLYLESIRRVAALPLQTVYPSHGAPDHDPAALFRETIRHRLERIEQTLARLGTEPRETEAIAREIYPESEPALLPLVVRATRAALEYLVEEGRAVLVGGDRFARAKE